MLNDTIVAIASAQQMGAIAIVRMSGPEAIQIVTELCHKNYASMASHTITYSYIYNYKSEEKLDEVLVSIFKAPKSYTCEDVVEINCHGGIYLSKQVLVQCIAAGARQAMAGEFSKRAFLNGRIDLSQVEATMDLIEASSGSAAKMAINALQGSVKALIEPFIKSVEAILANIEVNIDYPEYDDIKQFSSEEIKPHIKGWLHEIEQIIGVSKAAGQMREGIKTVIVGQPNVGKSSLLNALLDEDKAIVSEVEGTTRDIVEGHIMIEGIPLFLNDTAGMREAHDAIEKIGIDKSSQALASADLVILVRDASKVENEQDRLLLEKVKEYQYIEVFNKVDCIDSEVNGIGISAKQKAIEPLKKAIVELFANLPLAVNEAHLINERQIGYMQRAKEAMYCALRGIENGVELDLVSIDLQEAYQDCKEILGENAREDLLDVLFSRFCVGK